MCTISWTKNASSYEVFFNRDELLTRPPELPPAYYQEGGMRFLAPRDTKAEGTWIGVNAAGLTVALLNSYPLISKNKIKKSRGSLVWSLLGHASLDEIVCIMKKKDMTPFLPFIMTVFSVHQPVCLLYWDGIRLDINASADHALPVTSSSYQTQEVQKMRHQYFSHRTALSPDLTASMLDNYHLSTYPQLGPYSVCMKRSDACTKSYSRIHVDGKNITFTYQPEPWREPKPPSNVLKLEPNE